MPTLKGTEGSLSYVQCFLYLVSSLINVSILNIAWLGTFWSGLVYPKGKQVFKQKFVHKCSEQHYSQSPKGETT